MANDDKIWGSTKAERIFRRTYIASIDYIKRMGYEDGMSWTHLIVPSMKRADRHICTRTLNGVEMHLEAESRRLDGYERLGIQDSVEIGLRRQALNMVMNTINAEREALAA